ncbi:hypothetical protein JTB14_016338 [Gonioctena quinquepunctata]|nr:hypothetical protein JTB14_016338 [Gonioctena quinquepunctata]
MVENGPAENRSHALALMRFFSVDVDPDMNITSSSAGVQVPEMKDFWSKDFILKILQVGNGFICIGLYSEGLALLQNTISAMMFPNIAFGSLAIIGSVIILSYMLGCPMTDVLIRIFSILGIAMYFSAATLLLYVGLTRGSKSLDERVARQRTFLLITSVLSYFNFTLYVLDVYIGIQRSVGYEIKL